MNDMEKLLLFLESKGGKISINKCLQEMIKKQKEINNRLLSNTDYIRWLIDFTKDKEGFSDNDWDYSDVKLTNEDQINVDSLSLFFEGIYNYAKKNYIYSSPRAFGECYKIKMGNNAFEIGYITGQGTSFYCKKVDIANECKCIDFNDIINNKEQDNVKTIDTNLKNFSNMINDIYSNGVPIEAIEDVFNETIKNIISSERESETQKVFKKVR